MVTGSSRYVDQLVWFGSRIRASGAYVTDGDESGHDEQQGEKERYGQHGDHSHGEKLRNSRLKNGQLIVTFRDCALGTGGIFRGSCWSSPSPDTSQARPPAGLAT